MKIEYCGNASDITFQGIVCQHGEPVAFPDSVAVKALEQDCWRKPGEGGPSDTPPDNKTTGDLPSDTPPDNKTTGDLPSSHNDKQGA